ncbi:MAG: radical SAM protein [Desulfoferrobacter sp.]
MLLIHPPVTKPSEPPAGIARLAGMLRNYGVECDLLDANLEGLLYLIKKPGEASDRWTARAYRNTHRNLVSLKDGQTYRNLDRYKRTVLDLNRVLEMSSPSMTVRVSLTNYQHQRLSPLRSSDLLEAAEKPEENLFFPYFSRRLIELLEEKPKKVVGFSLNFLSQALCTFAMIGFLKRRFPDLTLIAGGGLITSWMRKPGWVNPFDGLIDHMIAGPGEDPLLSFLGLEPGRENNFWPDYTLLPICDYFSPGAILPYSASSGCYWNKCSFCPEQAEKNPYSSVPADEVIHDLRVLSAQTRPVLIHLLDNAISPTLMRAMSQNPTGVPWYGFTRITSHLTNRDFCEALRRSGCVMLKLGLESGDQGVLDCEQKGVNLETASKALRTLKAAGIATYAYLLFGTPSETLDAARKTLQFTVAHTEQIDFLNLAIFNLPVYGPDTKGLDTELLYEGDLSLYTGFVHPKGWHRGLVRQYLDKEFRRHPAISSILRREPPLFTSNHAPLFCV